MSTRQGRTFFTKAQTDFVPSLWPISQVGRWLFSLNGVLLSRPFSVTGRYVFLSSQAYQHMMSESCESAKSVLKRTSHLLSNTLVHLMFLDVPQSPRLLGSDTLVGSSVKRSGCCNCQQSERSTMECQSCITEMSAACVQQLCLQPFCCCCT